MLAISGAPLYKRAHSSRGFRGPALRVRTRCHPPNFRSAGRSKLSAAALTGEDTHGFARVYHARPLGGGRPFRPSVSSLEPENGALYFRHAQQYPCHRSRPDGAAAASGAEGRLRYGRARRPHSLRRYQAPGAGFDRGRGQALGAIFHQFALARRHADQLEDDFRLDPRLRKLQETLGIQAARALPRKSA